MGCFFELLFEIFLEGMFELIGYCYLKLMQLIVPDKTVSEKAKDNLKKIVTTVAALLAIVLIIGIILFLQDDPLMKSIGRYMTYIPLLIMALQIVVGIVVKIIDRFRK